MKEYFGRKFGIVMACLFGRKLVKLDGEILLSQK
jgi:hypothetical protein